MDSNELRASFLKYFEQNGHRVVPSSPLVPGDDPTLLFTNAGMNQFKDCFLGREKRSYTRAATSQKVMRVSGKHNDLDNVGPSHRHHTFFEMLGNFSFGDYFKKDAIEFAWTLLTDVWKMPKDRLVVSVFKGENGIPRDTEAYDLWKRFVPAERILELGADDNFWQMGETGPCGRCSEIYYVRGTGTDPEIEVWNNVFMEFDRSADGTLTPLPAPSIDTGMGLERLTAVMQSKDSNYDTDVFQPLVHRIGELASIKYGENETADISMRVVADHIRSTTFLIGDGVIPSNEWRGYVLRKIMRRAMRHGKHLGLSEPFLHQLVGVLVKQMGGAYPDLNTNRETIEKTILAEEHRFDAVLRDGLPRLEAEIQKALGTPERTLPGDAAFKLYDTFGVPYDFIEDTAATQDVRVDKAGFELAMDAQRGKARSQSTFGAKKGEEFQIPDDAPLKSAGDQFEGYTTTRATGVPVLALFDEAHKPVDALPAGSHGFIALARTPFYLEAGGQVSDRGRIVNEGTGATATVEGLARIRAGLPRAHRVHVESGSFNLREIVTAEVDAAVRNATRRNHTATHLLHAALRAVLGTHVKQAGSLVSPDRLRFDFVHFQPVTREELDRIERIVNEQIVTNTPVTTDVRSTEEAIASGAMALFGEKYGDKVRVVSVPGFSVELCGGTHVSATGDIGLCIVESESGVAAGVRRIEAVTGLGALQYAQNLRSSFAGTIAALNVSPEQAVPTIEKLHADAKRLTREMSQLKTKLALGGSAPADGQESVEVAGVKLARRKVADLDKDALRGLADTLKASIQTGVVVIASANDGKVQMIVAVTPDLTSRIKAGQIVKEIAPIVGGAGGGRPDFAEAGGKSPEKIDEMLAAAEAVVGRLLGR
ncbi:MAG TPA: alanine--tRNA ligase [Vicinamibacterales bacterium]|jgi:alanyl-tRNA synthetase|nr:alanine--tRNA ligase [Vicinamibacterales bacterium]